MKKISFKGLAIGLVIPTAVVALVYVIVGVEKYVGLSQVENPYNWLGSQARAVIGGLLK